MSFGFRVTHTDGAARRGVLTTAHGDIETPAFMPVGTQGAVKGITNRDLESIGAEIILSNTYHLYLRPGDDLIARRGGLHRFIGWNRPILTDSGGYQVFSLASRRTIDETGARFQSHLDGSAHLLTPEKATDIQAQLGSDIAMVLDECLAHPADARAGARFDGAHASVGPPRARALRNDSSGRGAGRVWRPTRARPSSASCREASFPTFASRAPSEPSPSDSRRTPSAASASANPSTSCTTSSGGRCRRCPSDRPRYLMGTGTPEDLVESVARGIDMFDCVLPTRNARNGQLFTSEGRINIKNAPYAEDDRPPDPGCSCYTCRTCSRAYLRHLFMAGEINASTLNTLHNLSFYLDTLSRIREAIAFGRFESFRAGYAGRRE